MTKYRNRKVYTTDHTFDSQKEHRRWGELQLLERAGEITELTREKADCTFNCHVNEELVCKYIADARYKENGELVYEDTKSPVTRTNPVYRIKRKLVKALFGVLIREV